jgi:hypothetical protein
MTATDSTLSPWHMLAPLDGTRTEECHLLELTRTDELHLINNVVAAARVSLIYAMSGNGKTSLINAGVIPFFQKHDHVVFTTRPRPPFARNDPRTAFRECILQQLPAVMKSTLGAHTLQRLDALMNTAHNPELRALTDQLRVLVDAIPNDAAAMRAVYDRTGINKVMSLADFVRSASELVGSQKPILIVCDQFEELFVHYSSDVVLQQFIEELGAIWADASLNVRLLFSMREDWVGSMIAFRRVIPDIFKDTFRLQPLTTTAARKVLTAPLEARGMYFSDAAVDRILDDLAAAYDKVEKRRLGAIQPDRAPSEVRFVELPALHLVSSKMWETRGLQAEPFSLEHYRSLPTMQDDGETLSPAGTILSDYLYEALSPNDSTRALQLDTLYLLTDGERHRRACSAEALARDLKRVRPSQLYASQPGSADINKVIAQPVRRGLVRCLESSDGLEYELTHDYVVRAVVRRWRELDRERAKEIGRLARDREEQDTRLHELEKKNTRLRRVLQIAPLVALASVIWVAISVADTPDHAVKLDIADPSPGLLVFGSYVVLLVAALINRQRTWAVMAGLALATFLASQVFAAVERSIDRDRTPMTKAAADVRVLAQQHSVASLLDLANALDRDTSRKAAADRLYQAYIDAPSGSPYEAPLSALSSSVRSTSKAAFLVLAFVLVALGTLATWLWTMSQTQSTARLQTFFALMWAELVDMLLSMAAFGAALTVAITLNLKERAALTMLFVVPVAIVAIRVFYLVRNQRTPSLRWAGYGLIRSRADVPIGIFRAVIREILFLAWTLVNLCLLIPWVIFSSLSCWFGGRTLPDLMTALKVERSSPRNQGRHRTAVLEAAIISDARGANLTG